jgi:tetratricopeptide (TPR) repeat protein/phage FluMu protein Com
MINFSCTKCHHTLEIQDDFAGMRIECPQCSTIISVPKKINDVFLDHPSNITKTKKQMGKRIITAGIIVILLGGVFLGLCFSYRCKVIFLANQASELQQAKKSEQSLVVYEKLFNYVGDRDFFFVHSVVLKAKKEYEAARNTYESRLIVQANTLESQVHIALEENDFVKAGSLCNAILGLKYPQIKQDGILSNYLLKIQKLKQESETNLKRQSEESAIVKKVQPLIDESLRLSKDNKYEQAINLEEKILKIIPRNLIHEGELSKCRKIIKKSKLKHRFALLEIKQKKENERINFILTPYTSILFLLKDLNFQNWNEYQDKVDELKKLMQNVDTSPKVLGKEQIRLDIISKILVEFHQAILNQILIDKKPQSFTVDLLTETTKQFMQTYFCCIHYMVAPITKYYDKFNDITRYTLEYNVLVESCDKENDLGLSEGALEYKLPEDEVTLGIQRIDTKEDKTIYNLVLTYKSESNFNSGGGKSLMILVDAKGIQFQGQGWISPRDENFIEKAFYLDVKPQIINLIANAQNVEVQFYSVGDSVINRKFDKNSLRNFRRFVDGFVDLPENITITKDDFKHPQNDSEE